ncbi:MAG: DUF4445 domain-containing protein [Solirubrobacterales bacterium]|nr:DUF4445 domain-containing protein [Solirubrobacterales bacterium]MBV9715734.1 DUF4445 domain-containing protein [Solirubrobacterales bacterium]
MATAAPARPAFEAAQIRCGMRAAAGPIEGEGGSYRRSVAQQRCTISQHLDGKDDRH